MFLCYSLIAYSLWVVSYYCFPLLLIFLFINFYFIRVFFQELCATFQPCKFYHFGKKTKTLPHRYIFPQRNERIKSDIKWLRFIQESASFVKCKMFSFESHKIHHLALLGHFIDPMTDFPTLSYPSMVKSLPFHRRSPKKVPLSRGASPYRPL